MQLSANQSERVCAVIVTYQPPLSLMDNLERLRGQVNEIIIVDNSSDAASVKLLAGVEQQFELRIVRNNQNLGIATALNIGIRHAIAGGYQWVVTFDQDSTVTPAFFKHMLLAYESCPFKKEVALVAPWLCFTAEECDSRRQNTLDAEYSQTRAAMTSGSLIKTSVFRTAGFYDEALFVDYVDYDFCLRLGKHGWKLIRAGQACLLHRLGAAETHSLFGLKVSIKSHSPWRRYFIMRNRIIVYRRHGFSAPWWCLHDFGWIFLELTKILLFESEKPAKLRHVFRGILDGILGKTGELMAS
jgi:rhamnosyltransferase